MADEGSCDCTNVCYWTCGKMLTCRSRIMRNFVELLTEEEMEEIEDEGTEDQGTEV